MIKEVVIFGAGRRTKRILSDNPNLLNAISFILDNDISQKGMSVLGKKIVHPSDIDDWTKYVIYICIRDSKEIKKQLTNLGLKENEDFFDGLKPFDAKDILGTEDFRRLGISTNSLEIEQKFSTMDEYLTLQKESRTFELENYLYEAYKKYTIGEPFAFIEYRGGCIVCGRQVSFKIYGPPDWRNQASCPLCHCESRVRYIVDRALRSGFPLDSPVYTTEAITSGFAALKKHFPNIIGSEYLGADKKPGEIYNGIRHEDVMNLSFKDNTFNMVISMDVFEHVADYRKGFSEVLRVLKSGGKFLFTVPVFYRSHNSVTRAKIQDGKLVHLKEPAYHGDPLSENGCLVFTDFGMDLRNILLECGFSKASYIAFYSIEKAYFGFTPIAIEAIK